MAAILETRNQSKSFGALAAVQDVSLAIEAGGLHSIIGPNGRRQDHALQPADRELPADLGKDSSRPAGRHGHAAHRIAHLGLSRSFQRTNVFPAFSLLQNVWIAAFATGRSWNGLLFRNTDQYPEANEQARQALRMLD
jgi:branched-chain amino acid transport system ATP-binding protein